MSGKIVGHKNGVNIVKGDNGLLYYNYGLPLRVGTEVCFSENAFDEEVADDLKPFPLDGQYSLRDNIISGIIGILIGAAAAFFMCQPIHAEDLSASDKVLIAQAVHAEAENQDLLGKRLVADVVLNRVEHEDFPDTVEEVIYQPGQFEPVENGSIENEPDSEDYFAVELETKKRTCETTLFFKTGGYSEYGKHHYQVGDHYFS